MSNRSHWTFFACFLFVAPAGVWFVISCNRILLNCVWCVFGVSPSYPTRPRSMWLTMRDVHITLPLKYPFRQRKAPADHSFPSASASYLAAFPNQWPRSANNELSSSSVFLGITSISDNSAAITPTSSGRLRKDGVRMFRPSWRLFVFLRWNKNWLLTITAAVFWRRGEQISRPAVGFENVSVIRSKFWTDVSGFRLLLLELRVFQVRICSCKYKSHLLVWALKLYVPAKRNKCSGIWSKHYVPCLAVASEMQSHADVPPVYPMQRKSQPHNKNETKSGVPLKIETK